MLIVRGQNPMGNVLHLVSGTETEFWMDLHGSVVLDITPLLAEMDHDRSVYLHISRCKSEALVGAQLHGAIANGASYPFMPPVAVFASEHKDGEQKEATKVTQTPLNRGINKKDKHEGKQVICSHCGAVGDTVANIEPAICSSCVKIELYFAQKYKSEHPVAEGKKDV